MCFKAFQFLQILKQKLISPHDFLLQPRESPRFTQLWVEVDDQSIVKKWMQEVS